MTQQGLLSLTPSPLARTPSTNSARVCWAAAPGLLPPTQQGFAELQLLLYDLEDSTESNYAQYVQHRGTQNYSDGASFTSSARVCWVYPGTYVQPQDSVERLSHAHTSHSAETQQKKVTESGSPQTAQRPSQKTRLDLAHFSQHRDLAEGCRWVWLTHTAQGLSRRT